MEKNVKLTIILQGNKVGYNIEGPLNFENLVLLTNTVVLNAMQQTVEAFQAALTEDNIPKTSTEYDQKVAELKGMLYDFYNVNASTLLQKFAPELELRPDISAEAILKTENDLIEQKYQEVKNSQNSNKIVQLPTKAQPLSNLIPELNSELSTEPKE